MALYFDRWDDLPKSMPVKERRMLVDILSDVVRAAEMNDADFPQELKDTVKHHHWAWIVCPLRALIDRYEEGER